LLAGLAIDAVMRRVGVGDALVPAHPRNPGRRFIEGVLRRGECRVMALNVQLAADGAGECFAHCLYSPTGRQKRKGETAIHPPSEAGGFLAAFL
jgi:hypothetical protein